MPAITEKLRFENLLESATIGHFARHANHQRVELGLEHVGGGQADLRIQAIHAQEQVVRGEAAQHLLGLRSDGRIRQVAHQAADDEEADVRHSARCIATFSPFVTTVSESSFSDLICLAISAVVVPESRMTVSPPRIRRAAA